MCVCVCVCVTDWVCLSLHRSNCRGLSCFQPTWERWSSPCSLIRRTTVFIVRFTRQRYTPFQYLLRINGPLYARLCMRRCIIFLEGPNENNSPVMLLCSRKTSDCFRSTFLKQRARHAPSAAWQFQTKVTSWLYGMLDNGVLLLLVWLPHKDTSLVLHIVCCHMMLIM